MPTAQKTEANSTKQARRIEIIRKSTQIFLDSGFAAASMAELAKACGIQKASFYHHFRNKDELFIACVIEGYKEAADAFAELENDASLSEEERLRQALCMLYDITVDTPAGRFAPLMAEVSRSMPDLSTRFFEDYIAVQRASLKRMVMKGVDAGVFKEPDFDLFYHLVFGPVVTLALSREMFAHMPGLDERFPTQRLRDGHIDALVPTLKHGLRPGQS
ncbi:MAG: TetR/AcrR family transcriptional regulator [Pseudomonadota bacterium]